VPAPVPAASAGGVACGVWRVACGGLWSVVAPVLHAGAGGVCACGVRGGCAVSVHCCSLQRSLCSAGTARSQAWLGCHTTHLHTIYTTPRDRLYLKIEIEERDGDKKKKSSVDSLP
jgi:hypothetical protein